MRCAVLLGQKIQGTVTVLYGKISKQKRFSKYEKPPKNILRKSSKKLTQFLQKYPKKVQIESPKKSIKRNPSLKNPVNNLDLFSMQPLEHSYLCYFFFAKEIKAFMSFGKQVPPKPSFPSGPGTLR